MRRVLFLLLLVVGAGTAAAAPPSLQVPLSDVLEVFLLDRDLIAVDAESGGQLSVPLRLKETLAWSGARGRVGVAITDQRILAAAVGSAAWQVAARQRGEVLPERALLGDRVALIVTSNRAIGFDGGSGNLVETSLGLRERVVDVAVGENAGVVVTDRRALGLSPVAGGFFPIKLDLEERIESVQASANLVNVTTNRRVLLFRTPTGTWEERIRRLR
ncbi:MAG: hypothetical protein VX546_13155 [Myxococcota bacterium]|nr:hypothetical protein [Myxococcota bacterium]